MGKNILFINQSSGYLMVDIINQFCAEGYKCSLITGSLVQRNTKLNSNVIVHKTVRYSRKNIISRSASWILSFLQSIFYISTKYRSAYIFYSSNPPLNIFIPLLTKNRFSFLIYDIYPNTIIAHNYFKANSAFAKFWEKCNRKTFNKCESIVTISESMREVLCKYVSNDKVSVIPVWADQNYFSTIEKSENPFLISHKLVDKFIVLYSGNLGKTHNIEILVEVANRMKSDDIFFLIIGRGEKENLIRNLIQHYDLKNCTLLPLQPVEIIPYSIGGADIGVVTIDNASESLSIPSKTYSLLAAGKPLLCIANPDTDLAKLVNQYQVGSSFTPIEIDNMVSYLNKIAFNPEYMEGLKQRVNIAAGDFDSKNARKFVDLVNL